MGGIGQNILREIKEDGNSLSKEPSIKKLLKKLMKEAKREMKLKNRK